LDLSGALRLAQDQVAIDHQRVGSQGCAIDQQLGAGADRLPL
jgi:hypothetical protein